MPSYDFPVEPGRIASFAYSVGDLDPVYRAQLFASERGKALITPPTFVRSSEHYDRSRGVPWGTQDASDDSFRNTDAVHAEQHFEYLAPFKVGDRIIVETNPGRTWTKQGRSGRLEFYETVTDYRNHVGTLLVRARKVSVRMPGRRKP